MKVSLIGQTFGIAAAFGLGVTIGMSSIGVVSAARALVTKTCSSNNACAKYTNSGGGPGIQGNNTSSSGPSAFGVLGTSSGTDGVHGTSYLIQSTFNSPCRDARMTIAGERVSARTTLWD